MEVYRNRSQKKSTINYKVEKDKAHGISAKKVSELVKKSHGIIIPARKVQSAVAEGMVGMFPGKRGNPGSIPDLNWMVGIILFGGIDTESSQTKENLLYLRREAADTKQKV